VFRFAKSKFLAIWK